MAAIFKQNALDCKESSSAVDPFKLLTAKPQLRHVANSRRLAFDMRSLPPGQYSFPYHFHRNAEELMVLMSGSMTLRAAAGLRELSQGDIVFFEMGETGAHQFFNHTRIDFRSRILRTP